MFYDYYLKADTQAEMEQALLSAGLATQLEQPFGPTEGTSLDIVGVIYQVSTDEDQEPVALPGYHVNVRLTKPLTEAQEATLADFLIVPPNTPHRVWG